MSYEYDSWGKLLSIKDENGNNITSSTHIGIINPYRYRSYRYDTETGLYYLQSRYYNPEWGRFINFDNYGGQVGELLSHNGYAYCKNNPVNMIDESGNAPTLVLGIFAIIVIAITITTIPQDTWTNLGEAITTTATGLVESVSAGIANITTKKETTTRVETTTKTTTKNKDKDEHNYWQADLVGGNVIIGSPISYENAVNRVSIGENVMCRSQAEALNIAVLYNIRKLEKPHGESGYYWHYHINGKHGAPHIWFYGEPYIDESIYY